MINSTVEAVVTDTLAKGFDNNVIIYSVAEFKLICGRKILKSVFISNVTKAFNKLGHSFHIVSDHVVIGNEVMTNVTDVSTLHIYNNTVIPFPLFVCDNNSLSMNLVDGKVLVVDRTSHWSIEKVNYLNEVVEGSAQSTNVNLYNLLVEQKNVGELLQMVATVSKGRSYYRDKIKSLSRLNNTKMESRVMSLVR